MLVRRCSTTSPLASSSESRPLPVDSFSRSQPGVGACCSVMSTAVQHQEQHQEQEFIEQDAVLEEHASPEPRKVVPQNVDNDEFEKPFGNVEEQPQQAHVVPPVLLEEVVAATIKKDELLHPSAHYIRFAQELAERKHSHHHHRDGMKKRSLTPKAGSSSSGRKSKSNSPRTVTDDHDKKNAKFISIPSAGSGGTLYIDTDSPQQEQRKIAATFGGGNTDRLSYLPSKLTHEVRKIAHAQELKVGGVIGSHMFPFARNNSASSGSSSAPAAVSRRSSTKTTSAATAGGKKHTTTTTTTTITSRRSPPPPPSPSSSPPKNFVSTARRHPVPSSASSSPSPGRASALLSPGSTHFSVPYSDESVPPMSRVSTKPAAAAAAAVGSISGESSRSPSSMRGNQQQDFGHLNHLLSPGRQKLLDSMKTAEWLTAGPPAEEASGLSFLSASGTFGAATMSRLLSTGGLGGGALDGTLSGSATFAGSMILAPSPNRGSPPKGAAAVVSKPLAARYVSYFYENLSTSGLDRPAPRNNNNSSTSRGASPSSDARGASSTTRSSSLLGTYQSPSMPRGSCSVWDELSVPDKDAVMQEWKCPALMRRLILEMGPQWLLDYAESP